ncbi:MAG: zinc-dependent metalloprotease [Propionibacteriaceae bacterium]
MTSFSMVDWDLALRTARNLVKPGPEISRSGAQQAVAELRSAADQAEGYVRSVTGLDTPGGTAPVLVVDRTGWIQANVDAFADLTEPLSAKAAEKVRGSMWSGVGPKLTGAELGAMLSYLAPKVLGQFDPFSPALPGRQAGRLLLVAPNIVAIERELKLAPRDFRLWVCLHEETHRVQFTAVPWLRTYMKSQVAEVVAATDFDTEAMAGMLKRAARGIGEAVRGDSEISLLDLIQTPQQRVVVDRITAMMSLIEGHAEVVMDSVGPQIVPSVAEIRRKFDVRRQGHGADLVIRRLLGLDAKMRQYRDGARFCRHVIGAIGMDGFNRVWTSPETLPARDEIADPQLWVDRMYDAAATTPPVS